MGGVEEGFSIISNKQRIFPAKCLTCGIKHVPQHNRNEMQGSDGKFYRVDLRNNCVFDQDEVFDVVPSQISLVQTAKQSRIQSAKGSNSSLTQEDHSSNPPLETQEDSIRASDLNPLKSSDENPYYYFLTFTFYSPSSIRQYSNIFIRREGV